MQRASGHQLNQRAVLRDEHHRSLGIVQRIEEREMGCRCQGAIAAPHLLIHDEVDQSPRDCPWRPRAGTDGAPVLDNFFAYPHILHV